MLMFLAQTLKSDTVAENRCQWEMRMLGKLCFLKKLTQGSTILELIGCVEEGTDSSFHLNCLPYSTMFFDLFSPFLLSMFSQYSDVNFGILSIGKTSQMTVLMVLRDIGVLLFKTSSYSFISLSHFCPGRLWANEIQDWSSVLLLF